MQPTTVLFDIGNVFVEWDPRFLYQKLIDDDDELNYFLQEVVTLDWHSEHDRGRSFADGVKTLSARFPEHEDLIQAFDARWNETLGPVIGGSVDILLELMERGVRVYGLTNFSMEKWPDFCRSHDFTDHFEGVVVSGEEGLIKPDPRIYHTAISRFHLDPEATIYVDDRRENVLAAEQLDMIGHQFTAPGVLRDVLEHHGLL